jgi:hypothetical protein
MKEGKKAEPHLPFLVMNHTYVCHFTGGRVWDESVSGNAFEIGTFKENAVIMDAYCRKFSVIGAEKLGWCCHLHTLFGLTNLLRKIGKRKYKFRFLVDEPIQLTFEQMKMEVLTHIIERKLYRGTGAGPELYRKMREKITQTDEFYRMVSFGGKWPF